MINQFFQYVDSIPVFYRLNKEGYGLLLFLFFLFLVAIAVSNILALILTIILKLLTRLSR